MKSKMDKKKNKTYSILNLILIYIITRFITYNFFEIYSNPDVIRPGWHILDLKFLTTDLIDSILHLHSQPPLWNFIVGIFAKISDGDLLKTSFFLNIFNYLISIGLIYYTYKILINLGFKERTCFYLVIIFIIFNPNVFFYENITFYNHILAFLFTNLVWLIILYLKNNNHLTEFFIYLNISVQSLIWAGIHPIILVFFFIFISYKKKSILKFNKSLFYFFICFILSISPMIKNKIIFNKFSTSTWLGINIASTMTNLDDKQCLYQIIYPDYYEEYKNKYSREIEHPVARISKNGLRNSVSQILLSDKCLEKSIDQIKKTPDHYIKGRIVAFIVSHSKFAFEYIYLSPINFNFRFLKEFLDNNQKTKRIKQTLIIIYMILFYYFFIKKIFLHKKYYSDFYGLIFFIYLFCILISHLFNGYEQERMMYQFQILHIIFISNIFKLILSRKKTSN